MPLIIDSIVYNPLAADPVAPENGQHWFNATDGKHRRKVGGVVEDVVASILKQTVFKEVVADSVTTSTTFVDLLSQAITTSEGFILVNITAALANTANTAVGSIRLVVDGVAIRGAGVNFKYCPVGTAIMARVAVTAAVHTVKVQWKTTTGTIGCHPVSVPNDEHLSLSIAEVLA